LFWVFDFDFCAISLHGITPVWYHHYKSLRDEQVAAKTSLLEAHTITKPPPKTDTC